MKHIQNFKSQIFLVKTDISDIFDYSYSAKH